MQNTSKWSNLENTLAKGQTRIVLAAAFFLSSVLSANVYGQELREQHEALGQPAEFMVQECLVLLAEHKRVANLDCFDNYYAVEVGTEVVVVTLIRDGRRTIVWYSGELQQVEELNRDFATLVTALASCGDNIQCEPSELGDLGLNLNTEDPGEIVSSVTLERDESLAGLGDVFHQYLSNGPVYLSSGDLPAFWFNYRSLQVKDRRVNSAIVLVAVEES